MDTRLNTKVYVQLSSLLPIMWIRVGIRVLSYVSLSSSISLLPLSPPFFYTIFSYFIDGLISPHFLFVFSFFFWHLTRPSLTHSMYIHTDPSRRIRRMRVRPIRGRPAPAYEANGIRNRDGWDVHVMSSPCVCVH